MIKRSFTALAVRICLLVSLFSSGCAAIYVPAPAEGPTHAGTHPEPKISTDQDRDELLSRRSQPGANRPAEAKGFYHKLRPGETLYLLSRVYEVPLDKLTVANGINDPSSIPAGTAIFVPGVSTPRPRPASATELTWPLRGRLTADFGKNGRRSRHEGIDIDGEYGDIVRAAAPGIVTQARRYGAYGRMVVIEHREGLSTLYAHLSELLVRPGDRVLRGDAVGRVGRSGNATGTHLHFEVRRNGYAVNPIPYLDSNAVLDASRR